MVNPNQEASLEVTRRANTPGVAACATAWRPGVLVVDDDDSLRDLLGIWLRRDGFAVWLAGSGREAVCLYRQRRSEIDAVLLDVRMPDLDGPETLGALRELNPQLRCCFFSGDLGDYTEGQLRAAGAAAVLAKPASLDEVARVLRLLAGQGGDTPAPYPRLHSPD